MDFVFSLMLKFPSLHSRSRDKSIDSSIKFFQENSTQWFLFHFPVSSCLLKAMQYLITSSYSCSPPALLLLFFLQSCVLEGSYYATRDQSS